MPQLFSTGWTVKMRDTRLDHTLLTYARCVRFHLAAKSESSVSPAPPPTSRHLADDEDEWPITPLRESIITPSHSSLDRRRRPSSERAPLRCHSASTESHIVRIAPHAPSRSRHPSPTHHNRTCSWSRWTWLALLHLLLLLTSGSGVANGAAQNASQSHSSSVEAHRNHSTSELPFSPSIPASLVSSLLATQTSSSLLSLSTSSLLLEELLQEQSLDKAIHKLTSAWHQAHGTASGEKKSTEQEKESEVDEDEGSAARYQMISEYKVKLENAVGIEGDEQLPPSTTTEQHLQRTRRSTKRGGYGLNRSQHKSKSNHIDRRMQSEDSRVYEQVYSGVKDRPSASPTEQHSKSVGLPAQSVMENCTRCRQKDEARNLRIETIKFNILNRLNMERAPNVSLKSMPRVPPINRLIERFEGPDPRVYESNASGSSTQKRYVNQANEYFGPLHDHQEMYDDFYVNAEKTIVFAQKPPADRLDDESLEAQYFKFPANVINSANVQHAILSLYIKAAPEHVGFARIRIYQIVRRHPSLMLAHHSEIPQKIAREGGWMQIELKDLVHRWFTHPEKNLGLAIHTYDRNGTQLPVVRVGDDTDMNPYFEVQVSARHEQSVRRKRMASLTCDDKSQEVRCCRYPLTIDFETFGWEWIIAPKRYEANYCSGECSLGLMSSSPHTHIISQTSFYNPTGPCCSPRKMSPISMLYMDHDFNIIYGILPNMVVDKCDCS